MKTKNATLLATIAPLFLIGCAGPSGIGSLGAGSDSRYLIATRGSQTAQISQAQEDQFERQHRVVGSEMDLETKKRRNVLGGVNDYVSTASSLFDIARRFVH